MIRIILYVIIVPLVVWCMDSVNINSLFKKGQSNYYQARVFYMLLVISISYLVVSFFNDFIGVFN